MCPGAVFFSSTLFGSTCRCQKQASHFQHTDAQKPNTPILSAYLCAVKSRSLTPVTSARVLTHCASWLIHIPGDGSLFVSIPRIGKSQRSLLPGKGDKDVVIGEDWVWETKGCVFIQIWEMSVWVVTESAQPKGHVAAWSLRVRVHLIKHTPFINWMRLGTPEQTVGTWINKAGLEIKAQFQCTIHWSVEVKAIRVPVFLNSFFDQLINLTYIQAQY